MPRLKTGSTLLSLAAALCVAAPALAQAPNIEKLKQMKVVGHRPEHAARAAGAARTPTRCARTSSASSCRRASRSTCTPWCPMRATWRWRRRTNMLFVGTRKTTVWAVTDRNSDGVADEVKPFAPSA